MKRSSAIGHKCAMSMQAEGLATTAREFSRSIVCENRVIFYTARGAFTGQGCLTTEVKHCHGQSMCRSIQVYFLCIAPSQMASMARSIPLFTSFMNLLCPLGM